MDDQKKNQDESSTRRSFLLGLGKWSAIVVATVTAGLPAVGDAKEGGTPGTPQEEIPAGGGDAKGIEEHQWCRVWGHGGGGCRVWGHGGGGCRVWGNGGCRVWGDGGGCRVWGDGGGCRVWGNSGCRVWGNGTFNYRL